MHDCPNCGQICDCSEDLDDYLYPEAYFGCKCDCEGFDEDDDYPADPDDWAFVALNQWVLEGYVSRLALEADRPSPSAPDRPDREHPH